MVFINHFYKRGFESTVDAVSWLIMDQDGLLCDVMSKTH